MKVVLNAKISVLNAKTSVSERKYILSNVLNSPLSINFNVQMLLLRLINAFSIYTSIINLLEGQMRCSNRCICKQIMIDQ